MKKILALTLALLMAIACISFTGANNGKMYAVSEIASAAYNVCKEYDNTGKIPSEINVGGDVLCTKDYFILVTGAVVSVDSGSLSAVELLDVDEPLNSVGNNINIYIDKAKYTDIAKTVWQFMERYDRVPNYGASHVGKINCETLLIAFSRAMSNYFDYAQLPASVRVKYVYPIWQNTAESAEKGTKTIERIALMDAAERLQSTVEKEYALPQFMFIDGMRFTMSEIYYAFAEMLIDFSSSSVSDVEVIAAQPPEQSGEELENGEISRSDYMSMARKVVKSAVETGMVPSYCEVSLGSVSMESGIYAFAELIEHFRYKYYLPETYSIRTWETLTGNTLPKPAETADPTPRPTPTPYDGVGAMPGDDFARGAVGVYGAVSSGSEFASRVGIDILKAGGNAVDAAVATMFAVGLCEPSGSGVGGAGLSVIYLADEAKYIVFDYMGQTPNNYVATGSKANRIAIPGIVHGAISMLEKYGTMELEEVIAPSIELARNGFEVTETMAYKMTIVPTQFPYAVSLYRNGTTYYQKGDIYTNPDLADTYELIAKEGIEGFYNSDFTDLICDYLAENGSTLTRKDFSQYTSFEREPLTTTYRGYKVYTGSGSAQGGSRVISMLNTMSAYNLSSYGHDSAQTVRVTAMAFGLKPISGSGYEMDTSLLDGVDLEDCAWYDTKSTTMLVTYDKDGNMVAANNTLGDNFGVGVAVPGTGFCFNSGIGTSDGTPGSRISSTMAPTIVAWENELPMLGVGSPGNAAIITATAITISNVIDFGMNVSEAINAPRIYGSGAALPPVRPMATCPPACPPCR